MRGKHLRRRSISGPVVFSSLMIGVGLSLAVPRAAGEPGSAVPSRSAARTGTTPPSSPERALVPTASTGSARPGPARRFTIAATGDILLHQALWERAVELAHGETGYDFRPMFAPVRAILSDADLAICHLETPVSRNDQGLSSYPRFSVPHEITDAIAAAGYDTCSTASNHSLDDGMAGTRATLDALDRSRVAHAGTARSRNESRRVTFVHARGVKVAQLSYSFWFNGLTPEHAWQANRIQTDRILDDARRARTLGSRFTVVSLHWGTEGSATVNGFQRRIAERLTRSPFVDAIVGHHAHIVQPIERVNGKVVAYGLGNFLSGMVGGDLWPEGVEDGEIVVLRVELRGGAYRVTRIRTVPTTVEYGTWRIVPDPGTHAAVG
jgi:poly-gamma-glutamate capsule biosynthesis protein CapA/YwtB (metallophosphatase superfamily)